MADEKQLTCRHVITTVGERVFHLYDVDSHHWVVEVVYHPGRSSFGDVEFRCGLFRYETIYFRGELSVIKSKHLGDPFAMAPDVHKLLTNFLVTLGKPQ